MYEVKVNPELFLEEEIPKLHPKSPIFKEYWREQKERCIYGYWQSGVWMTGKLYFYVNFGTIKLNKGEQRGVKQFGRPWLRDLEWQFFYNWDVARGFSGFEGDKEYSCHRALKPVDVSDTRKKLSDDEIIRFYCMDVGEIIEEAYHNIFKGPIILPGTEGVKRERKTYVDALEYITRQHESNLGRPLYFNQAKNFMMLGSRGFGKSYSVGHVILHEWLFDGRTRYDRNNPNKYQTSSEVVVGAGDAKYSADLLEKTRLSFERLPGGYEGPTKIYPAPFFKNYTGSWQPAKQVTAQYKKKVEGGNWKWEGTKSNIKHRTFKDNPFAANGTRPGVIVFEECFHPSTEVMTVSGRKQIQNVQVGELLLHKSETPTEVRRKWEGEAQLYEIQQKYGNNYKVTGAHKLVLHPNNYLRNKGHESLKISVEDYLKWPQYKKKNYQTAISCKQGYGPVYQPIDAYLLGLWLGDGNKNAGCIYNSDENILSYLRNFEHSETGIKRKGKAVSTKSITIKGLRTKLGDLSLLNNKHIPKEYLVGSEEQRKKLLAGVIDADGHLQKRKVPSYEISIQKYIGFDLVDLCRSLGYRTTYKEYDTYLRITVRSNDFSDLPVKVEKKKCGKKAQINMNLSPIKVKKAEVGRYIGIQVDSEDHNFLLADYSEVSNCGMFDNLIDSYNASVECMRDGAWKFGSAVFLGTGGDFQGGGTRDAYDIFYNPEKYDCVVFHDEWESKGDICYFVPAYLGLNDFKDPWGNTDHDAARNELEGTRAKLSKAGGSSKALDSELQNRPIVPSEMFLANTGNIFPIAELKNRLNLIERDSQYLSLEKPVQLYFDSTERYGVGFRVDTQRKHVPINKYPWDEKADREGCVVIYEEPIFDEYGDIPKDLYIIGHDPVRTDDPSGGSLASIYVLKTKKHWKNHGHDEIVAQYVGRPYIGREKINEILMKLSMLYGNAKIYFEAMVGNVKEYFEKHKKLHLLAKSPTTIFSKKASYEHGRLISYGFPMSSRKMKLDGLQYIRDWLLEEREVREGVTVRNLDRIWDRALLQELIGFDLEHGNYDRVMGFMGCVLGMAESHNKYEKNVVSNKMTDEALDFLINNKRLFRSGNTMRIRKKIDKQTGLYEQYETDSAHEAAAFFSSL